jgi:hypothetical protein
MPELPELRLGDLLGAQRAELENLYRALPVMPAAPAAPIPRGRFLAHDLGPTDSWERAPLRNRAAVLTFWLLAPRVDFERRCWFFGSALLAAGRFDLQAGASRWRDTQTLRLHYHPSRLPRPLRAQLYDELKPLSADLCLGIAGLNAPRGRGDLRFFALARRKRRTSREPQSPRSTPSPSRH